MTTTRRDIYQEVTDKIIAQLERGERPGSKGWRKASDAGAAVPDGSIPRNIATGARYRGVNILLLWIAADEQGFDRNAWMTYKQAQAAGGQVRKGERGTMIVKYGQYTKEDQNTGEEVTRGFLKGYTVFNIAQIDGLTDIPSAPPVPVDPRKTNPQAEAFFAALPARIRHGGDRAYYSRAGDFIGMPHRIQFHSLGNYYAVLAHELTHWTGHESRCDRVFGKAFKDREYCAEELVAELGAAFLCADLGIDGEQGHARYLGGYLDILRADPRALISAASKASDAADYLHDAAGTAWQDAQPTDDNTAEDGATITTTAPAPEPAPLPVDHGPDGREQLVIPGAERQQPAAPASQLALF